MDYIVKITSYGWFTCDFTFEDHDGITHYCPVFETMEELRDWIVENS